MDLSRLVSIGLFPAKRAPLKPEELSYLQSHGVEKFLADLTNELVQKRPADPYKVIAEAAAKLSKSGPAAPAPAAPAKAEPGVKAAAAPPPAAGADPATEARIKEVGDQVRTLKEKLKAEGLSGTKINAHEDVKRLVEELQRLKGGGAAPAAAPAPTAAAPAEKPQKEAPKKEVKKEAKSKKEAGAAQPSKGGGVDIKKADDVPGWYEQVIMKSELIEQYPVKGCFILRPWAYKIWEEVQRWFDGEIKRLGVENCYFPMFIPRRYIEKEESHLDDFAPELAWVAKFGKPNALEDLEEPVAIRPTSETAMYDAYSNWVQSHRDLPLKLNQWCSVVRWEVKQTTPFLRTREFLWQEGHTAHANKRDADKEVLDILELYAGVYEKLMAVPVVRGTKTKAETFPGAEYTTTVEAFIPATGRAIQGATSHHLGQSFSKMFDISFQDPSDPSGKARENAYQNSWGITQRTLGVMIMVHGDDRGLQLAPPIAGIQVVIIPVGLKASSTDEERETLGAATTDYLEKLQAAGMRAKVDERDNSPGWKFNYWEMKGVPLRIELGPLDLKKGEFVMAKRNVADPKAGKVTGKHDSLVDDVRATLEAIHREMYETALAERDERLVNVDKWEDFSTNLNKGRLCLVPFCGDPECEEQIKELSKAEAADAEVAGGLKMGAKSLCMPHEEKYNYNCPQCCIRPDCTFKCFYGDTVRRVMFGRSY